MKKLTVKLTLVVAVVLTMFQVLFSKGYYLTWIVFGTAAVTLLFAVLAIVFGVIVKGLLQVFGQELAIGNYLQFFTRTALLGFILVIGTVLFSELTSHTPATSNIAEIERVRINDTNQYITVRGEEEDNPIILFLAGGPGGSQLQPTRMFLSDLEEDYTIINWEQPGSGMSYHAYNREDLTVEQYILDAHELTTYLKETYDKEKVYIIGESWGSYVAIELAKRYPEDYHAILTAGQMVDFVETEIYCYNKALEVAEERNDQDQIDTLLDRGVPPYYDGNLGIESGTYLIYLHHYMNSIPEVNHTDYNTFDDLFSPEYSIRDSVQYLLALLNTFDHVYRQLYDTDLRETHTEFSVPIYMIHGKYDVNAPLYLAEDYYDSISAPNKEFILFEHSGHNPWINEPERFQQEVRRLFQDES
jgi:pimeloyl-ACP methyl ester carboxylesterase